MIPKLKIRALDSATQKPLSGVKITATAIYTGGSQRIEGTTNDLGYIEVILNANPYLPIAMITLQHVIAVKKGYFEYVKSSVIAYPNGVVTIQLKPESNPVPPQPPKPPTPPKTPNPIIMKLYGILNYLKEHWEYAIAIIGIIIIFYFLLRKKK